MFSRLPVYTKSYSLIALPLLFWGMIATAAECDVAQAISVQGRVEVLPSNTKAWKSVHQGDHFCPGDRLRLGANSRAGLTLHNETLLRLDEHTSVTINAPAEDGASWLDLLKGAAHFISRITNSFQVRTPYVNASIEGTEFVVNVKDAETDITVFEGVVVASNDAGSLELTANQSGRATSNQAPVHITYANPRDAVAWALYYPPLPEQPDAADNLAQQTVTAIAQNRLEDA
ncbi:MAG: FecR family protein, partial [Candidatus Thiodiazotropha sp. (ex Notomyrtea botanica)]|nr:FecR family protein [Candidatus Thiodiazotropha sp. (ex Notomyrtea botanica)]